MSIDQLINSYKKKAAFFSGAASSWAGISNVKYQSNKEKETMCREFIATLTAIKESCQDINNLTLPTNSIACDSVKH